MNFLNPKLSKHFNSLNTIGRSVLNYEDGRLNFNTANIGRLIQDPDGSINLNSIQSAFGDAQSAISDISESFGKFSSFFKR